MPTRFGLGYDSHRFGADRPLKLAGVEILHTSALDADSSLFLVEAWSGAVVRLGKEVGVPTPIHEMAYASLLPLELRGRGQVSFD